MKGAENYLKSADAAVWMTSESHDPPPFYPMWFEVLLDQIMDSWGMKRDDITPKNCKLVYINLMMCIEI